jgi:uncharacterized protein (DUF2267 family)
MTSRNAHPETYSTDEQSVICFRHIKRDLGARSTREVVRVIRKVLVALRKGMNTGQAIAFIQRLPSSLQMLMLGSWDRNEKQTSVSHLDELVENIYSEDRQSVTPVFSTEVHALNAVVVVLQQMDKYLKLFSHNILSHKLVSGVKQIPMEDAA